MAEHREGYHPANYHPVRPLKHLGSVDPIKAAKRRRTLVSWYVGAGFACVALVLAGSAGAGPFGFLLAGTLVGCAAGLLFRHLPGLIDRAYDRVHHRRSRR